MPKKEHKRNRGSFKKFREHLLKKNSSSESSESSSKISRSLGIYIILQCIYILL